ncbi:MAG TPA: protein kinase [Polyangiaceae bacterium]|nr:protein kinase [Polyangiaceae bacterium]
MAGEYRLLRKLGEGGFGAVYEAEHPLLKRKAAVKVLHRVADRDSDAVQRFISEAQAVNQIRNRHIIDVFSFGKLNDGRHFYVMDLLDGEPLDRWLKRQGRLDASTALQLLTPIAGALDLAHAAGIVHRDLKPQNIFLAWDSSGDTVPKLLDFGMAKLLGDSTVHTVSGTPIGTPLYMSPEQARGERVDRRSDVYALGVLAFEMLTGQLPFVGDTTVAVLMAHIIQAAPHASEVAPLPEQLDAPLLRMLDKDPEKRPASAGEAIAALRQAALDAGLELSDAALRLPKPEFPVASDPPRSGEPDTLLDDMSPTARDAVQAASAGTRARPLWPFAIGLIGLGAVLGFAVLRPSPAPQAEPIASVPAPAVSATLAAATSVSSAAASAAPAAALVSAAAAAPSASALPASATPVTPRAPDAAKARPARTPSAARIPTDLENPF